MFRQTTATATTTTSSNTAIENEALKAAREVGPHAYKLEGLAADEDLCYIEIGCGGDGSEEQIKVANLINAKIKELSDAGKKVHFLILLGDNIYPNGASSPFDKAFTERIENMYHTKVICVPGNHDGDIQNPLIRRSYNPREVILNETAHNYVPEGDKFPTVAAKRKFWEEEKQAEVPDEDEEIEAFVKISNDKNYRVQRKIVNYHELQNYIMPNTVDSYYTEREELFIVDSNMLAEDFINWTDWKDNQASLHPKNQIPFLIAEYEDAKKHGRKTLFKMHQLPITTGERGLENKTDTSFYIPSVVQVTRLKKLLETTSESHNEFIRLIFKKIEIELPEASGAHDHYMELYDDGKYLQIVSGGGGSEHKQQLVSHLHHPNIKFSVSQHGYTLNCGNQIQFFTTDDFEPTLKLTLELTYDKAKHTFIYAEDEDNFSKTLRPIVLTACDKHITELQEVELEQKKTAKEHKIKAENNPGIISSMCNGVGFYFSKSMHLSAKAIKKISGYNFNYNSEQEIASVYKMMAFFNQHKLDKNKVLSYLAKWKNTYEGRMFYTEFKEFVKEHLDAEKFPEIFEMLKSKPKVTNATETTVQVEKQKSLSY